MSFEDRWAVALRHPFVAEELAKQAGLWSDAESANRCRRL